MNTKATHTPGPWEAQHYSTGNWGIVHGITEVARIDTPTYSGEAKDEANARLLAAAPDMLDALKILQTRIFMLDGSENPEYQLATKVLTMAEGD